MTNSRMIVGRYYARNYEDLTINTNKARTERVTNAAEFACSARVLFECVHEYVLCKARIGLDNDHCCCTNDYINDQHNINSDRTIALSTKIRRLARKMQKR